ncbi:chitinase domain-containing protein 1 [Oratosquilla oratoria]|uniref:chitinase domain-containing protein 1 n=1 Tax=Oratosquilla oratoria TaxID=337810 RepID=UPI003F7730F1
MKMKSTLLLWMYLALVAATLTSKDKKKKEKPSGAVSESVITKGLVTEKVKWKDIVTNHDTYSKDTSRRNIAQMTLGFVTPWNNHGYDIAKTFANKFTHISPVWLQLKYHPKGYHISGLHDVDTRWMNSVKKSGLKAKTKIVPRIIIDNSWNNRALEQFVSSQSEQDLAIQEILHVLKINKFDGIVLEIWSQVPLPSLYYKLTDTIQYIAKEIRRAGFVFILVIPPPIYPGGIEGSFGKERFEQLVNDVDAFSLMTYDFATFDAPGPNSPIRWMRQCVEKLVPEESSVKRHKILMGLNFYGMDHSTTGGNHVTHQQYINILSTHKPKFSYDDVSVEHFFEYQSSTGKRKIFYPTLFSINARVNLAKELYTGLSVWELGQGLDYFYDLV